MTPPIAILGAAGAVGGEVTRLLADTGHELRLGGRRADVIARIAPRGAAVMGLSLDDERALERFCDGCRLVINCAGPSYLVLDRVARAALQAGADYVDPGGDVPLQASLARQDLGSRRLVLSAGMMPGLSGLIPRWLAGRFERCTRLVAHVGGRDRLSPASARDYLLSLGVEAGHGALAAWRRGTRVARALSSATGVALPFFPGRVSAFPFLSSEGEAVARALKLDEVEWYNVLAGTNIAAALARLQGAMRSSSVTNLDHAAAELARAAELDMCDGPSYQVMTLHLEGERGGVPRASSFVLRASDPYRLTAWVTALASEAVLRKHTAPGCHLAAEVLAPTLVERIEHVRTVELFEVFDHDDAVELVAEEGAL